MQSLLAIDWPRNPQVQVACTTRLGGASVAPFDQFNLGDHVGDDPTAVAHNRAFLGELLSAPGHPVRPVFLNQVHGVKAFVLGSDTPDGTVADAAVATVPGVACTIMVADCLPVLFATDDGRWVAAAHAGWRGLLGTPDPSAVQQPGDGPTRQAWRGVLESVLEEYSGFDQDRRPQAAIKKIADLPPTSPGLSAWLGPCIGPQAFEVGDEVRQGFLAADPGAFDCFRPVAGRQGKWLADLAQLARRRLMHAGLPADRIHGNDGSPDWCTVTQSKLYFSHRRDTARLGGSGRMAACVWLRQSASPPA